MAYDNDSSSLASKDGDISLNSITKPKSTWKGALWDTFDSSTEERRLLFKLDAVLLTFASLGYFLKNLDQSNINSAFVSGMKEDLGMFGNQLTTAITMWTIGYVIGQIPSNLLLTRVSPRWWIPTLELGWGICTLFSYKVKSYQALYGIRFLVGLFEAGFYPGMQYIIGNFYTPRELGKRAVIFHTAGGMGTLLSSVLQAAAYSNLNGHNGLAGWRWLFIIDAVITIPIAALGYVFLPALPGQSGNKPTFWLSQAELDLTDRRMAAIGRKPKAPITKERLRGFLKSWHLPVLTLLYVLWNNSLNASSIMPLWLKSFNTKEKTVYTVPQINHLPMAITGVYIITAYFFAWTSDGILRGRRWIWLAFTSLLNACVCISLANLPVHSKIPSHFVLYYMTNIGGGMSGLHFAWANEICTADNEERALVVASMNDFAYVVQAIVPNFVWKQTDYPKSTKGLYYSFALSLAHVAWTLLTRELHQLELRKNRKAATNPAIGYGSTIRIEDEEGGAESPGAKLTVSQGKAPEEFIVSTAK
ncbi:MFS general substrate transporter [Punctularia strigosozonata HHB-11173 SS5]|uniref:MFS general substrate transporter n=1 Tax=Punctularia strigosozonata (strain HHB-11173) TaxID=741275 RepID=UPI000441643A|nr:MFS general substrate transporter [Punctularia strigosozonata HHB-11173 SS5]EIN08776.1 MFS general substrate transporter [Punctularia strigosozonata HHB-11173 SS5]